MNFTYLKTNDNKVNKAYYTAMSDVVANIQLMNSNFHGREIPVLMAGMGYFSPWTRDAAINTVNADACLFPEIAKNIEMYRCYKKMQLIIRRNIYETIQTDSSAVSDN